jgi:hypothetical protein
MILASCFNFYEVLFLRYCRYDYNMSWLGYILVGDDSVGTFVCFIKLPYNMVHDSYLIVVLPFLVWSFSFV